jgi:hypothetical protein
MSEVIQLRPPQPSQSNFGELIQLYLETRDAKAVLERKQKEHTKQYSDVLHMIEGKLMAHLQEHGVQSLSSDLGTAYLSHKRSAPIHDAIAFKQYVIDNQAWDMLDWKANITAVGDYLTENEELPPGVSLKSNVTLGVMRK